MHVLVWNHACLDKLRKGLVDENERDQDGEDLLGEARDEADEEAPLHRHDDQHDDDQPHAHPDTAHNVLETLGLAELKNKDV